MSPSSTLLLFSLTITLLISIFPFSAISDDANNNNNNNYGDGSLSPPSACTNCTICQYPCHPQPPPPSGDQPYAAPPPPSAAGQVNCPPAPPVQCCGGGGQYYAPPTTPFYNPYNNYSGAAPMQLSALMKPIFVPRGFLLVLCVMICCLFGFRV